MHLNHIFAIKDLNPSATLWASKVIVKFLWRLITGSLGDSKVNPSYLNFLRWPYMYIFVFPGFRTLSPYILGLLDILFYHQWCFSLLMNVGCKLNHVNFCPFIFFLFARLTQDLASLYDTNLYFLLLMEKVYRW